MATNKISFDINCDNVMVNANNGSSVTATIDGAERSDLFDLFDVQEAIDHFGERDILDQIGEDAVRKHFNISEE